MTISSKIMKNSYRRYPIKYISVDTVVSKQRYRYIWLVICPNILNLDVQSNEKDNSSSVSTVTRHSRANKPSMIISSKSIKNSSHLYLPSYINAHTAITKPPSPPVWPIISQVNIPKLGLVVKLNEGLVFIAKRRSRPRHLSVITLSRTIKNS
nr:unnamed protein product [Callosobruchus analis]